MSRKPARKHKQPSRQQAESAREIRVFSYEITYESMEEESLKFLPTEVRDRIEYFHAHLRSDPRTVIPELKDLARRYPKARIIRNYLAAAYQSTGDTEKNEAQVIENYRLDPDYHFARVAFADLLYRRKEFEKIPEVFGGKLELKSLYPERNLFHISEVLSFYGVVGPYYCMIGKLDVAETILDVLKQLDPNHPITGYVERIVEVERMKQGFERLMAKSRRRKR